MRIVRKSYKGFSIVIENWPEEKDHWWFLKRISNAKYDYSCSDAPGFTTEQDAMEWAMKWIDSKEF